MGGGGNPGGNPGGGDGIPADAGPGQFAFVVNGKSLLRENHVTGTIGIASIQRNEGLNIPPHEFILNIEFSLVHAAGDPTPRDLEFYVLFSKPVPATFLAPVADSQRYSIGTFTLMEYYDSDYQMKEQLPGAVLTLTKFDTVNNLISGTYHYLAQHVGGVGPVDTVTSGYFHDVPIGNGCFAPGTISATCGSSTFSSPDTGYNTVNGWTIAGSNVLVLMGSARDANGTSHWITLHITDPAVGSFPLGITTSATNASYSEGEMSGAGFSISTATGGSGTITVTKYDVVSQRISGTFEFTAPDQYGKSRTVSNGAFNNVFCAQY